MQAHEIRTLLHAAPFESFTLHLANGRKFPIDHPDLRLATTHAEPESKPAKRRKK